MKNFGRKTKVGTSQFLSIIAATEALILPFEKTMKAISSLPSYLDIWVQRANHRRHLMLLDDRLLNDIGLSRMEAEKEAKKPFWRA